MKNFSLVLLAGFLCVLPVYGVNTAEIEQVRNRTQQAGSELSSADRAVISQFWIEALDQMLLSTDSEDMVEVRRQMETQKGTQSLSFYTTAYITEGLKNIQTAFQNSQRIESPQQQVRAERNLMILTANLKSPKLVPIALERVGDEDEVIRYWAVKAVTQPDVLKELTGEVTPDEEMVQAILKALNERILVEPLTSIQKMIVEFAASFNSTPARQILLSLAEERKKAYQQWTVKDELLDAALLRGLGNAVMLEEDAEIKKTVARTFAELYSLVFQRYMKGAGKLSSDQIDGLTAVIGDVDQSVVYKTMGIQTRIAVSLQRRTGLNDDYEMLFGNRQLPGELGLKFKFDYGKDTAGKPITIPPELGPMPEPAKAENS